MGLDIWFKEDIANILRAANEANLSALAAGAHNDEAVIRGASERGAELRRAYRQGFVAALTTLWLAFGLSAHSGPTSLLSAEHAEYAGDSLYPLLQHDRRTGNR